MNPYASPAAHPPIVASDAALLARVPAAPREPTLRARPLVFGFGPGGWIVLIVGVGFLAMGSLFTMIFCAGLPTDLALAFAAKQANGTVTSVTTDSHVRVNGQSPKLVSFEYVVEGRHHLATSSLLGPTSLRPGASVTVDYLPASPDTARVVGTTSSRTGYGGSFVVLFPTIGLLLSTFVIRAQQRRKRAFRNGTPAVGRVTSLALDRTTRVNGRSPMKLSWSFQDASGRPFVGSLSSMDSSFFGEQLPEQPLVVLYDPKNPKVNVAWIE